MRILCITGNTVGANSYYRVAGIMPNLRKKLEAYLRRSVEFNIVGFDPLPGWATLIEYDIILAHCPNTAPLTSMLEFAKNVGIKIWCDYDDHIFGVPLENKVYQLYNSPTSLESAKKCMEMADVVTVTTKILKDLFTPHNNNILVVPNAINDLLLPFNPLPSTNKTIMWRGSDTHQMSIIYFRNEVNKLLKEVSSEWDFIFVGYQPWGISYNERTSFVAGIDTITYLQNTKKISPSVGHVLLMDNTFNRCRSNVAYLESTYFGAVTVAPDWQEWQVPGILNYKTKEEYLRIMQDIVAGNINLPTLHSLSYEYISDCLLLSKVNEQRVELVLSLMK